MGLAVKQAVVLTILVVFAVNYLITSLYAVIVAADAHLMAAPSRPLPTAPTAGAARRPHRRPGGRGHRRARRVPALLGPGAVPLAWST